MSVFCQRYSSSVFLKLKFMFIILRITIHKKKFSNKENGLYVKILQDTN